MSVAHIEARHSSIDEDPTVVTAYCGQQGLIWMSGDLDPKGFDFVLAQDASNGDCAECLAAYTSARVIAFNVLAVMKEDR